MHGKVCLTFIRMDNIFDRIYIKSHVDFHVTHLADLKRENEKSALALCSIVHFPHLAIRPQTFTYWVRIFTFSVSNSSNFELNKEFASSRRVLSKQTHD